MPESTTIENDFLSQVTAIVEKNISNEKFGVSELADEMNMSRSNLLRKVKKVTKLSVSQMISQIRLKRSMEMLRKSSLNVSEVSHQVGFSSTSYFIKCFREYYGYPPGEVGKRDASETNPTPIHPSSPKRNLVLAGSIALAAALAIGFVLYESLPSAASLTLEKSIAVLPFKNDSNDSTNVYLINGLMESTLTNLQKIKDLKVISRTSVEKYRNTSKSIAEMAKELGVSYFVEGSGQKIGEGILLNIQLIEASTDKHLWARQYRREAKDIFDLQQEIAKDIAQEIKVIITPEEEKRIEKDPTDNLEAYDNFLKGKDLFYKSTSASLRESIPYFKKAIELDNQFALAYANAVMVYYYLDIFRAEKMFTHEVNGYADKAMSLDANLGESLIAKALAYANKKEYKLAVPYLEKALEYNPNSGLVIHFLTEFYSMYVPNPAKYLEYALKGVQLDIASSDSATVSFKYFHLSNALIQAGFIDEGIKYVGKSLAYNPQNYFSGYVGVLFHYAKNKDLKLTRALLIKEFEKDTSRADIVKEVAKICYVMRDYESAFKYYKKFLELREAQRLEIFREENLSIAFVFSKMGLKEKSEEFIKNYKDFADNDQSIYKHLQLAMYFSYRGDAPKAIEHMKMFSKEDNYYYWILLLSNDPIVDPIKDLPEFKKIMRDLETKFWNNHKKIKETLEEKELL
jgi:TolB-like protein/AraC-like DNA-binding protein/Tfp pilus assembly protein PilF